MEWLCRRRRVVALGDLVNEALGGRFPDKDSVAVTFDDGFANNFEVAVPVLRALGVRACFFVATDFIDLAGRGEAALREWEQRVYRFTRAAEPMRWDQLRALSREGFEIGVHTRSHPDLSRLGPDETRAEIEQAVARLESELGARPVLFAYPYGKSAMAPPPIRSVVMASGGFRAAFSTERGWNLRATSPDWFHPDSMEPHFSPRLLDAFLCGCFDRE
jgi:peptidoglycan/xylan/chitin deacetylase (PgdA/CDA1 family)